MVDQKLQQYSALTVAKCMRALDAYFGVGFSDRHKEFLLCYVTWRLRQPGF
jgi:hypothetical protein